MRISSPLKRWTAVALISLLVGCYGRFPLTNALYDWNGSVTHHRVGQSLIMWLLVLIPVYQACMVVDGVLINTIEYLSGRQVMASATSSDTGLALQPLTATNAILHVPLTDGSTMHVSLVRVSPTRTELRDPSNTLLGIAIIGDDGNLHLCDAREQHVALVSAHELAVLQSDSH